MPFLNQRKGENDSRKYFMINLHERMLPTSAGVEPATSWSPVGRRIQLSHRGRLLPALLTFNGLRETTQINALVKKVWVFSLGPLNVSKKVVPQYYKNKNNKRIFSLVKISLFRENASYLTSISLICTNHINSNYLPYLKGGNCCSNSLFCSKGAHCNKLDAIWF